MDICAGKGSKMEEKNKTQDARNIKGMDEDQFQAELAELMKEEPGGKKKKGNGGLFRAWFFDSVALFRQKCNSFRLACLSIYSR